MMELRNVYSKADLFDLTSIDLSSLSVDAVEEILSDGSFCIESEDDLLLRLLKLGSDYRPLLKYIDIRFLSSQKIAMLSEHEEFPMECVWSEIADWLFFLSTRKLDSVIVSEFPDLFAEFGGKQFSLLWRGGRDGFDPKHFHSRCDGHANTLTLIEDTKGNIFGGFTPLKWESLIWNGMGEGRDNGCHKTDPSLKSFIFTLKNPHEFPARKFGVKAGRCAMFCDQGFGPHLGDIFVRYRCATGEFGNRYTNDTGLPGKTFFTGSQEFRAKEIEVFEITD
jgi:hypothetical protein